MKEKICSCLAGTILTLAIINPAFSQKANKVLPEDSLLSSIEVSSPYPVVTPGYINDISTKAIRDFVRRYKYTQGEKWRKVIDGYIALFEKDNIAFKVSYDLKGYWISTTRTYTEKYLPTAVRHPVKSAHYDFSIYLVREIQYYNQPLIYFIYLRKIDDETSFRNIIYSNGEMQEVEPYNGKWRGKTFSSSYN